MADIELAIKISEDSYKATCNGYMLPSDVEDVVNAIKNGIPLPKGHGRLIDSDKLDTRLNFVLNHTGGYKDTPIGTGIVIAMAENLDAPTVLDAEAGSEPQESEKGYSDGVNEVLDKVRDEILDNTFSVVNPNNTYEYINVIDLDSIDEILGKYKSDSEDKK